MVNAPSLESRDTPATSATGQLRFDGDARLLAWVHSVLGNDVHTSLEAPRSDAKEGRGVGLYCWALEPATSTRSQLTAPLRLSARYVLTTWSPEPTQACSDLCELVFSALETPMLDVDLEPPTPAFWAAFGIAPRPSLGLRLSVQRVRRAHAVAPWVRQPLVLASTPLAALQGRVVGPGGVPLAAARVELPGLGLAAQTAASGQFHFAAVPQTGALQVRVLARGHTQAFSIDTPTAQPLQLDMNFT